MQKTPAKEHRRPACSLLLKRFLQVVQTSVSPVRLCLISTSYNHCAQAPILDFGVIKLGTSKSLECSVENLDQQEQQVIDADVCNPALDSKWMPAIKS